MVFVDYWVSKKPVRGLGNPELLLARHSLLLHLFLQLF